MFFILLACSKDSPIPEEPSTTQYTLIVTASEGGSVSPYVTGTYDEGTQIGFSEIPNKGYVFDRWEGTDRDGICVRTIGFCRTTFTINSNRDIQAFFESNSK